MHYFSRVSAASFISLSLLSGACGDAGGGSTTSETSNGPTTAPSTSEPVTTTGASSTTNEPTSVGTTDATSAGPTTDATSAGPTTGSTGSTTGATTDATVGETTSPPGSTGPGTTSDGTTDGTTGGGDIIPCETDKDCTLADGCCECNPIGPGEQPVPCDIQCLQSECSAHGLEGAAVECRFGRCTFADVACNPLGVTCNSPEPVCPPGQVASVEDTNDGKCWTGACVFAEACDWVKDCSYCDSPELVCVGKLQKGAYHVCDVKPLDCGDSPNIDCECGQQICDASPPHTVCQDAADDIDCECPFC